MDTLEQFLRNGQLGEVRMGASTDDVRSVLGEPPDVSTQKKPTIWKYGSLQLGFFKESRDEPTRLAWIALYWHAPFLLPAKLSWQGWRPDIGTTRQELEQFLAHRSISFASTRIGDEELLVLSSGVHISFEGGSLDSMQFTAPAKSKKKQLSLALSEDLWQHVNDEAQRRKVSPAHLCSEWIHDRVQSAARST